MLRDKTHQRLRKYRNYVIQVAINPLNKRKPGNLNESMLTFFAEFLTLYGQNQICMMEYQSAVVHRILKV